MIRRLIAWWHQWRKRAPQTFYSVREVVTDDARPKPYVARVGEFEIFTDAPLAIDPRMVINENGIVVIDLGDVIPDAQIIYVCGRRNNQ